MGDHACDDDDDDKPIQRSTKRIKLPNDDVENENMRLKAELAKLKAEKLASANPAFCNIYHCSDLGNKVMNTMKNTHEKFPLGAAAELIDNAREAAKILPEGTVQSIELRIEKELGGRAISFTDNGKGMNYKSLYLMLKPGKGTKGKNNFGQGFKTGTMGLGGEALVLTNDGRTRGLAFLSRSTNKLDAGVIEDMCIPFAFWHPDGKPATHTNPLDIEDDIKTERSTKLTDIKNDESVEKEVLSHIYNSKGTAVAHFEVLRDEFRKIERGGTRIIVWMLHRNWVFEEGDICLPPKDGVNYIREDRHGSNFPPGADVPPDYSLASYCQILFLERERERSRRSKFKVVIMGKEVEFTDPMSPFYASDFQEFPIKLSEMGPLRRSVTLRLTLAYSPEDDREGRYGCHIYWNDTQSELWRQLGLAPRLVQPYLRLGTQDRQGLFNGVLGRLELTPQVLSSRQPLREIAPQASHPRLKLTGLPSDSQLQCSLHRSLGSLEAPASPRAVAGGAERSHYARARAAGARRAQRQADVRHQLVARELVGA